MIEFNLERVRRNVCEAETEDLLDRITVYRSGMEPEAIDLIESELRSRDITLDQISRHREARLAQCSLGHDGIAQRCTFCHRPAVAERWGWHRLWGIAPVFPRLLRYCTAHLPERPTE